MPDLYELNGKHSLFFKQWRLKLFYHKILWNAKINRMHLKQKKLYKVNVACSTPTTPSTDQQSFKSPKRPW